MNNEKRLGDGPIEQQYFEQMKALARTIDEFFNGPPSPDRVKQTGFILMVFPFTEADLATGGQGRANYISNADRKDVVVLLKEQLARFEGQPEMKGHA